MRTKDFDPDDIADAAMQVFWQRGYAATSVQDLVDGTGLSRSSLYGTFENKQGLFQHALRRYEAVTTSNVELLSGPGRARDLVRQLLLRIVQDELSDAGRRGCLVANAALELAGHDEAVAERVAGNFQRLQRRWKSSSCAASRKATSPTAKAACPGALRPEHRARPARAGQGQQRAAPPVPDGCGRRGRHGAAGAIAGHPPPAARMSCRCGFYFP